MNCVICGNQIGQELTDETGMAHLKCAIQEQEGCKDDRGTFTHCWECWNPCSFRQHLPEAEACDAK